MFNSSCGRCIRHSYDQVIREVSFLKIPMFEDVGVEVDTDGNTDYSSNEFVRAVCGVAILSGKTSSGSFWNQASI